MFWFSRIPENTIMCLNLRIWSFKQNYSKIFCITYYSFIKMLYLFF